MQEEYLRYTCQMILPGFDKSGQDKLKNSKVLIIGIGGLGCPAAQYLAAAGIGTLGLADFDTVSLKNLHRQILFSPGDVGLKKADVAARRLLLQNPQIDIVPVITCVDADNVLKLIDSYDIIIDATDNFESRYLINDACVYSGKPLVYGAIYQYEGQVAVWNVKNGSSYSPNYRDVFPDVNASQVPDCAEGGVLPTIAGIIGCWLANEAVKYLTGIGELLEGKMLILDVFSGLSRIIHLNKKTTTDIRSLPQMQSLSYITPEDLKTGIKNELFELIDVRTISERNEFNIGGSHIPLNELDTKIKVSEKPLVFYCATGKRSAKAARLVQKKFPSLQVYSLKGGLNEWR